MPRFHVPKSEQPARASAGSKPRCSQTVRGMWFADLLYSMESLVPHIGNVDRVQEWGSGFTAARVEGFGC